MFTRKGNNMATEQIRKILIVEDSPEDRELICGYLNQDSKYNYILWQEALGEKGLAQVTKIQPDCVLLDFELPDMDGLEFLSGLAENSIYDLPVIMLTGYGDERLAVQAIKSGALDYLSKYRLSSETLLGAIDNAIRKANLQRELLEQREQLEKSEALLRLALEAGRMGVWEWDILTDKVRLDGSITAIYGTDTGNSGSNYADFIKLLHPDHLQLASELASGTYKPGEKHTTTLRYSWPDDSIHWVENKFEYFFATNDQPVRAIGVVTDITERIQVEEELARRKQQFETLAENSPDIITRFNRQLQHVYINNAIQRLTGLSPATFIGKTNHDLDMPLAQCDLWDEKLRSVFETGHETSLEFSLEYPTGLQHYHSRLVPEFKPDGSVEYVLSSARDITEQKQADDERSQLLSREQAMRHIAEQAARRTTQLQTVTAALSEALTPGQVAEVIVERGLVALNAFAGSVFLLNALGTELELLRSTGYPEELLQRMEHFDVQISRPVSHAARTGELVVIESLTERQQRYPGIVNLTEIWKAGSLVAIPLILDGRRLGAIGLNFYEFRQFNQEDRELMLTLALLCAQALERARLFEAEQYSRREAEASQKRLVFLAEASVALGASLEYKTIIGNLGRLTVPTMADWCVVITRGEDNQPDLLEVTHSDPAKELLLQQIMLQRYSTLPQVGLKVLESGQSLLLSEISAEFLEETFPNLEHRELLRSVGAASVYNAPLIVRGKTIGMVGFNSATPGYYTEADVPLMEELARRIAVSLDNASLYQRVQRAVHTQEELNQLKDLFISIATHELRNPLTAAKGFTQLLQRNLKREISPPSQGGLTPVPSKNLEYLAIVDYQLERMDGLINQLIDFSRVQNKKLELRYNRGANLLGLVQRIVEQQERIYPDRPIDFQTSDEVITADFDEARLEQVLTNLINNAIKYSPPQTPVIVGVEKRYSLLTPDHQPSIPAPLEAVMWVRDEGYGISPEDQARIFERFYRVSAGEGLVEGLGLGLYISQEIVAQHDGRMWLESVPGKGSTFYCSIPLN